MFLAGDIGGTKTHLALFSEEKKKLREAKYSSLEYAALCDIVSEFLESDTVSKACFGVAGPVRGNSVQTTNLPWNIDRADFPEIADVRFINDLEANAFGLFELQEGDCTTLNEGRVNQKGNCALISAGTGLGEAGLYFDGEALHPFACEGGHCDLAPRNDLEIALWRFIRARHEHVSYERVLSGAGMRGLYDFFVQDQAIAPDPEVENAAQEDKPRIISENGSRNRSEATARALELFAALYGAEAGNCALKFMALGGVYIGGGIAPQIVDTLKEGAFIDAFVAKGRFRALLQSMPVHVVHREETALLGAMHYAVHRMHAKKERL